MAKKTNGKRRIKRRGNRDQTFEARKRVLQAVKERGIISSSEAGEIGGWGQSWFHLHAMAEAGQLVHAGYNQWMSRQAAAKLAVSSRHVRKRKRGPKRKLQPRSGSARTRAEAR